jgi:hypothetical protein
VVGVVTNVVVVDDELVVANVVVVVDAVVVVVPLEDCATTDVRFGMKAMKPAVVTVASTNSAGSLFIEFLLETAMLPSPR